MPPLAHVVGVDVVAEDLHRVGAAEADRGAGEAEAQGARQRLGQVASVAGGEAVLAAVGLVGDHDQVAAARQHRMLDLLPAA